MSFAAKRIRSIVRRMFLSSIFIVCLIPSTAPLRAADDLLNLDDLIEEGLKNSPELRAFESRVEASKYRIPQANSLPDPMLMFGYQNEGFRRITIGEEPNAQGMFSLSQMFFFPWKAVTQGRNGDA